MLFRRMKFFENSLDLDLLTVSADGNGDRVTHLAFPDERDEFRALTDLLG